MLVTMGELLDDAREKRYALGSLEIPNLESAQGILEAATEERAPVILAFQQGFLKLVPFVPFMTA